IITNGGWGVIFLVLFNNTESASGQFTIFLRTLLWYVIWHTYFRKSKRVKATYGDSAVEEFIGLGLSSIPVRHAEHSISVTAAQPAASTPAAHVESTLQPAPSAPANLAEPTEAQNKRSPLEALPPKKRVLKRMEW